MALNRLPPWVSLAGRFGIRAYSQAKIEYLRERFGGNSYMPNLFEYFVSLGLELTRPGGYFSIISMSVFGKRTLSAILTDFLWHFVRIWCIKKRARPLRIQQARL